MKEKDWIKRYSSQLLKFIERFTENKEDAQDIFQETLIAAIESLPFYKRKSSFFTWLCGIARHEIIDYYRKKRIKAILFSRLPWLEKLAKEALGPEEEIIEKELKEKINTVLKNLSEGYQVILRLKYIEGRSMAEIAEKLRLTIKAVESRLSRARLAFRQAWKRE